LPSSLESAEPTQVLCSCLDMLDNKDKIGVLNYLLATIKKEGR